MRLTSGSWAAVRWTAVRWTAVRWTAVRWTAGARAVLDSIEL